MVNNQLVRVHFVQYLVKFGVTLRAYTDIEVEMGNGQVNLKEYRYAGCNVRSGRTVTFARESLE